MNYKDKITLQKEVLTIYKAIMPNFYKNYRQYSPVEIRQQVASVIVSHVFEKNCENLRSKKYRIAKKRARRCDVKTEQIKAELDNFALEI
jgi:hypothetical protein